MLLEAIYHKPYSEYAYTIDRDTFIIRLRTKRNDLINAILIYHDKYDPSLKGSALMKKVVSDKFFDFYEAKIPNKIKRLKYMFYLEDNFSSKWFNVNGFFDERPEWGFFAYSHFESGDVVDIPEWTESAVIYQIFPDRFKKSNDVEIMNYLYAQKNRSNSQKYYGGNVSGIMESIDYLTLLGINTIYLNPVFKSCSYHRYDTEDYYTVDPLFGTNQSFKKLIKLLHEKGIRVILDAVFNHCSTNFFAFKDVVEKGLQSKYCDWFYIYNYPVDICREPNYECFGNFGSMPKINTKNPEVIKYFKDVLDYWMTEFEIDGLRFDVADEISRDFLRQIRRHVKSKYKECLLAGEIWDNPSSWLWGDQLDTSINYPLKSFINDIFAYKSINVKEFIQKIGMYYMSFNLNSVRKLINIIGTHDTPRFLTLCNNNIKRFELGVVLQFTLPGVPMIYYGDEIGMAGGGDPDCRSPFDWKEENWNKNILDLYKELIKLRKNHPALRNGRLKFLEVNKDVLTYSRCDSRECFYIVLNTSSHTKTVDIKVEADTKNLVNAIDLSYINTKGSNATLELEAYSWKILKNCPPMRVLP